METTDCLGKILYVDLTSGRTESEPVDREMARTYLGGFGINQKLAHDLIKPGIAPLDPANTIIFASGVLGGTVAPATSKMMATTKCPITGAIGTAFGGTCGDALKQAGFGHVVVSGRADKPVVLSIHDDDIELLDASFVWGKDIHETTDMLRDRYGSQSSVIAIGPPGELLSPISFAFCNKMGHLGQGGLGAVMGSKNLKAVLLRGTKGVEVVDRRAFVAASDKVYRSIMDLNFRDDYIKVGSTIATWGRSNSKRHNLSPEETAADIYGPAAYYERWRATQPCPTCPIGCKFLMEIREGDHAGELSIVTGFGAPWEKFNPGNIDRTLELRDFCNRQGLDDGAVTAIIDLVLNLYENGVITGDDTDGMELHRDYTTVKSLTYKIARREGIGDLLAEGYAKTLEALAKGDESYGETFKGHFMGDPRGRHFQAMTIAELVSPRGYGGIHGLGPSFMPNHPVRTFRRYLERLGWPEEEIDRLCSEDDVNLARLLVHTENLQMVYNCLGICERQPIGQCYSHELAAQLYNAATGFNVTPEEMIKLGERVYNLYKMNNVREGFSRVDDKYPEKWVRPLVKDGKEIQIADYFGKPMGRQELEQILDDYYDERDWDLERGVPTPEKLEELGIGWVSADIPGSVVT